MCVHDCCEGSVAPPHLMFEVEGVTVLSLKAARSACTCLDKQHHGEWTMASSWAASSPERVHALAVADSSGKTGLPGSVSGMLARRGPDHSS